MKNILIGSLLASLAMFVWGAIYWMNPLAASAFETVEDDAAAQAALQAHFLKTGVYYVPGNMDDEASFQSLHEKGPLAMVQYIRTGKPPMAPQVMVYGWLHMFVLSLLLAGLLTLAMPSLSSYAARVGLAAFVGLLIGFFSEGGAMIWFYQPVAFSALQLIYAVSVMTVGGLVLALFVKPGKI